MVGPLGRVGPDVPGAGLSKSSRAEAPIETEDPIKS